MSFRPLETVAIRRQAGGFCAEGPGFYVWDDDARTLRETVRDLVPAREDLRPAGPPGAVRHPEPFGER